MSDKIQSYLEKSVVGTQYRLILNQQVNLEIFPDLKKFAREMIQGRNKEPDL
jgi:hypothetical protein